MESLAPAKVEISEDLKSAPLWMKRVPMITGVLAGLAGFLTVRGANMSNEAIYRSNQAVLFQAQASDKWAEYQADSVKARVIETTLIVGVADPAARATLQGDQKKFRSLQETDKADAAAFESKRDQELLNSHARLAEKDLLDYAGVAAQLGIALASVAALTKKQAAFNVGLFAGVIALAVTGYALLIHFFSHG
jgi:hypothetical protein